MAFELIAKLAHLGIELRVEDDRLICNAPKGAITPEIGAAIRESKAEIIDAINQLSDANAALEVPLERVTRDDNQQMSFSQESLWFIDQLEGSSALYNIPYAVHIAEQVDNESLCEAIKLLTQRHEILRTTFRMGDGRLLQEISPDFVPNLSVIDLSQVTEHEKELRLKGILEEESQRVFDLVNGPLWQCTLVKLGENECLFTYVFHHIIFDEWSRDIFETELNEIYAGLKECREPALSPLDVQYVDFSHWQRNWLQGEVLAKELSFWVSALDKAPPFLALPADYLRPKMQSFNGAVERLFLSGVSSSSVRAACRERGVTPFMMLLAAFNVLLYRYSNSTDIIVGSPSSGRNRTELEGIIGCFVNTLVFRNLMSGDLSFSEFLDSVKKGALDVYAHQDVRFEELVKEVQPERNLSYSPLFQVMFVYESGVDVESSFLGKSERVKIHSASAKFDLTLTIIDGNDRVEAVLEYNTDLFRAETIQRMLSSIDVLLEAAIDNPDKPLGQLSIMGEQEQNRLLYEWNATTAEYPSDVGFHQLIEAQSLSTPDAVAVQCGEESLTYDELNRRANKLAHYLVKQGVKVETLVGICMNRSIDMMVSLLGVLKAGGAYLPLDPAFPAERLAFMLDDAKSPLLLIESALRSELPETQAQIVCVNELGSLLDDESDEAPLVEVAAENLAYVIYTSGSTGKPKGVQVPHGGVANFLNSMARQPGLTADDVLVAVTTLSFDIAVLELYLPLIVGGKCVIATRDVASDGQMLLALLDASDATVMQATPTTWRLLIAAGWKGNERFKVLCGGEAMPRDLIGELISRAGSVWNMYGPTETTVWSTCYQLTDADAPALIGKPIDNTQIYILDERMSPVPAGVYGEIYIGGSGVTRGYLDRPALTAERFIDDPFSEKAGAKLYLTGDLGRYLADGNIEYQSRNDGQVKVRGFRIELGEIESNLVKHPSVDRGVVIVREDRPGDQRLVAYVVFKLGLSATVTEIREHLRAVLPEYMIPQHLVELDELPLSPNGKVDRKSLPAPFATSFDEDDFVEPETESEKYLAGVWKSELNVERVGVHDNFFDLGGHSLLSMMMVSRIRKETGVSVSPRLVLMESMGVIASQYELTPVTSVMNESTASDDILPKEIPEVKEKASRGLFGKLKNPFLKKK